MTNYALMKDGSVENVIVWDGVPYTPPTDEQPASGWSPPDGYSTIALEDGSPVSPGWTFDGTMFAAPAPAPLPPKTAEQIKTENTATRDGLLSIATNAIAPLQDAVDLDIATDLEQALLKQWKQFRVAVNRVDLTVDDQTWPGQPSVNS